MTTQHPRSAPGVAQACQVQAQQLARLLLHTLNSKQATLQQLNSLFLQHEDHPIFASLPGAGELLAPSLLVKFGEDRRRFPPFQHGPDFSWHGSRYQPKWQSPLGPLSPLL
ncbi:hypothetical protein KFU94_47255 [Chloroflexi bacterium TSY]|nr:hypothetical protein [Chloroflexi bacterium TSY]